MNGRYDGESPSTFAANQERISVALEWEPELTDDELCTGLDLDADAVARALAVLLTSGRVRVTVGRRNRCKTYSLNPAWIAPESNTAKKDRESVRRM